MGKIIAVLVLMFSSSAFAHMDACSFRVLKGRNFAGNDHDQIVFARNWVETEGGTLNQIGQWSQINILERWQTWRNITRVQRDRAMALEIMKISPPPVRDQQGVVQLDQILFDKNALDALSAQNLERMLKRTEELFPAPENPRQDLNQTANKILSRIRIGFIRPVNTYQFAIAPTGYDAPIASPRELAALNLGRAEGYYSQVVGRSPSVEFMFQVTKNDGTSPASLTRREVFSLDPKFAYENGFVLPRFHSLLDLIDFFEFWDPQSAEKMFRANWVNLPKSIQTYEQFRAYLLASNDHSEIFHPSNAYTQMAALRTQLRNFVLTPADAERFLKQAFKRMVISLGTQTPIEIEKLSVRLTNSGAINHFFSGDLMNLLHMPYGMGLRIPIAVTASHYILSRKEDPAVPYPPKSFSARIPIVMENPYRNGEQKK